MAGRTVHRTTLISLPSELQFEIMSQLSYPDALSLKLTCRHFSELAGPALTVVSRVTWLLGRAEADLPIPKTGQLRLHNDAVFLQNEEVQRILRARRRHEECAKAWQNWTVGKEWPGCLVVPGSRLCDQGLALLEVKGVNRPTWNHDDRIFFVSERMRLDGRRARRLSTSWTCLADMIARSGNEFVAILRTISSLQSVSVLILLLLSVFVGAVAMALAYELGSNIPQIAVYGKGQ